MFLDAHLSIGVDAQAEFVPELIFFPYFARIDLVGEGHILAFAAGISAEHWCHGGRAPSRGGRGAPRTGAGDGSGLGGQRPGASAIALEGAVDAFSVETILCSDGPLPADLNTDGLVNGADLSILLAAWGTNDPVADLSEDGTVGGPDLSILLAAWGSIP